jgi:hypothetical protein
MATDCIQQVRFEFDENLKPMVARRQGFSALLAAQPNHRSPVLEPLRGCPDDFLTTMSYLRELCALRTGEALPVTDGEGRATSASSASSFTIIINEVECKRLRSSPLKL